MAADKSSRTAARDQKDRRIAREARAYDKELRALADCQAALREQRARTNQAASRLQFAIGSNDGGDASP